MHREPFGFGVFLPMANGGFIVSRDSPQVDGSYLLNRQVSLLAEDVGFDFGIAMAKWRGFGGDTRHWDYTLDSLALCCGLAEATNRIDIYCTLHTTVFHPVPVAKMIATLDQITSGRAGLNVVAKPYHGEISQMGIPPVEESSRYDYAREWITIVKRLWEEDRVDFSGEFFQINDCVSDPKPLRRPRPRLICAGISDIGRRFSIEEVDACLISARDHSGLKTLSRHVKSLARKIGRTTQTIALIMIVPGSTNEGAHDRIALYNRGADLEALRAIGAAYGSGTGVALSRQAAAAQAVGMMSGYPMVGDAARIIDLLTDLFQNGELDGVVLTFPDYIRDLEFMGEEVIPVMIDRGFSRQTSPV
ncbi:LLM class flavin-dependent oxidoreductase [Streptomyces collinus]|uniref:LLM class flavin-dependent oxidoreductase n=1 Tax=Streptomyces collinus TaxID=42684 RepID=UPI0036880277